MKFCQITFSEFYSLPLAFNKNSKVFLEVTVEFNLSYTDGIKKYEYGGTRTPDLMVRSHKL